MQHETAAKISQILWNEKVHHDDIRDQYLEVMKSFAPNRVESYRLMQKVLQTSSDYLTTLCELENLINSKIGYSDNVDI